MSAAYSIGLTGDAGSGKTTVLEWLASQGAATFDADAAVHARLDGDEDVIEAVVARFGSGVACATGPGIDRQALAAIVFSDSEALTDLERLVHPVVCDDVRAWLDAATAVVAAIEAVKLIESGLHEWVDEVWLLTCESTERRRRLLERGWTSDQVAHRLAAAPPMAPRLAAARVVVDTTGTWEATTRQLAVAWSRICRLARTSSEASGG